jgi:hypothetical protein
VFVLVESYCCTWCLIYCQSAQCEVGKATRDQCIIRIWNCGCGSVVSGERLGKGLGIVNDAVHEYLSRSNNEALQRKTDLR